MDENYDHDNDTDDQNDEEIVRRIHDFFRRSLDADQESRSQRLEDLRFCALGDQWPQWSKRDRMTPGRERPMLVINRTKQFVMRATNQFLEAIPQIKARPVDDNADPDCAKALTEVMRHIHQSSNAEMCYGMAVEPQIREGIGYCRVMTEYAGDGTFDQEIKIKPIPNPYSVYFDPTSILPNGSDARACLICEDMSREEFERQYGKDVETGSFAFIGAGDQRGWNEKNTVRVAEYYELETETTGDLLLLADGSTIEASQIADPSMLQPGMVVDKRPIEQKKCMWYKVAGSTILDRREIPCTMLPIVRFAGAQVIHDGKMYFHGMVRDLTSSQIQYNYQQSAMTEMVGMQPLSPWVAPFGATEDFNDEWSQANRVPFSVLRYKPVSVAGTLVGAPERQPFAQIPNGAFNLLQLAIDDMKAVTGQWNASQGSADESDQSGRAILAQQRQGDVSLAHFSIHANQAIEQLGRVILDMIPRVYTRPTLFRILGEDGEVQQVAIDPNQPQAKTEPSEQMRGVEAIYNPGMGKYDVAISTGPSFATRRAESAAMLMDLAQKYPPLMQIAGDLVVSSLDSPVADKIADRLRPPTAEGDDPPTPREQQLMQQAEQAMAMAEQLQQQLQALGQKIVFEEEKLDLDRYKAMTDRLNVLLKAPDPTNPAVVAGEAAVLSQPVPQEGQINVGANS
jgi:hypothetical protein